jgi:hypothetical protein
VITAYSILPTPKPNKSPSVLSAIGGKSIGIETARAAQCDDIEVANGRGHEVKRAGSERRQCGVHALTYQKNRRKKIVLAISQRFAAILEHIDCLVSLTPCFSGVWAEVGGS